MAEWMRGAWYKPEPHSDHVAMEPCRPDEVLKYDALPDATAQPMTQGEKAVLAEAKSMMHGMTPYQRNFVMQNITDRVASGLRKFGPYEPTNEVRNLLAQAADEASNVVVYCAMHRVARGPDDASCAKAKRIGEAAAKLVLELMRA